MAVGLARARDAGATRVAWAVPDGADQAAVGAALAEGTLLAAYRFDRYKSGDDDNGSKGPEEVEIVSGEDLSATIREVDIVVEHQNTARDLQNLPSNDLTPVKLAEHALRRAAEIEGLEGVAFGPDEIEKRAMGGLLAVTKGSHEEPRFIVLRYDGGGGGPLLALVGKAVTFDSGGISIKPSARCRR